MVRLGQNALCDFISLVARSVILKSGAPQHLGHKVSAGDELLRQRIFAQSVGGCRVLGCAHRFLRGHKLVTPLLNQVKNAMEQLDRIAVAIGRGRCFRQL
jgi:hypothetical protein